MFGGVAGVFVENSKFNNVHVPAVKVIDPPNGPVSAMSPYNSRIWFYSVQHYFNLQEPDGIYVFKNSYMTEIIMYSPYFEGSYNGKVAFINKGSGIVHIEIDAYKWGPGPNYLGANTGTGNLKICIRKFTEKYYKKTVPVGPNDTWGTELVYGPFERIEPVVVEVGNVDTVNGETITVEILTEDVTGTVRSVSKQFTSDGKWELSPSELMTLYNLPGGCIKKLRVRAKSNLSSTNALVTISFVGR